MDDYANEEMLNELRELEELKKMKMFLESENIRLRSTSDSLTGELEGMKIAINSAISYIASYEGQRENIVDIIDKLKSKKEAITSEIDSLYIKIKAAKEDKEDSLKLKETLKDELNEIVDEKSLVMKKIEDIQNGLEKISQEKGMKVPNFKWYSLVLKSIYKEFAQTRNRMEVAIMMKKR